MNLRAGLLSLALPFSGLAQKEKDEGERLFSLKINALLESKCLACHSAKEGKTKGDLDLSFHSFRLALFIETHHDDSRPVAMNGPGLLEEHRLAFLEGDGIDHGFALDALEPRFEDAPF